MTSKTDPQLAAWLPADMADVALIPASICAAIGGMSLSWWHEEVRAGRAPAPTIRRTRCTRWHAASVREFWRTFASQGEADTQAAALMTAKAKKASAAARDKRAAVVQGANA